MSSFFSDSFHKQVKSVVAREFPSLPTHEINYLGDMTFSLLNNVIRYLGILRTDKYEYQLKQNNFQDTKGFMYMLLPYINDESGLNKQKLTKLSDLILLKHDDKKYNINIEEPKYLLTNFQYNYFNKSLMGYEERPYVNDLIKMNYNLLIATIKRMANHLMPNWIDVIPVGLDEIRRGKYGYMNNSVYRGTLYQQTNEGETEDLLGVDEVYETIYSQFYYNIRNHKWLIYDYKDNNTLRPFVYAVNMLFNVDNIINNRWASLDALEKRKFEENWKIILKNSKNGLSYKGIPPNVLSKVIVSIIIFFDKYYSILQSNDYKKLKAKQRKEQNQDEEDIDGELVENKSKLDQFEENLKLITPMNIFDFLKIELESFNGTYYGSKLKNNNYSPLLPPIPVLGIKFSLTAKNLYNYAKSLVTKKILDSKKDTERHVLFHKFWSLVPLAERKIIGDRLSHPVDQDPMIWFNISKNLKKTYNIRNNQLVKLHIYLHNSIRNNLGYWVLESMVFRGILTKFIPQKEITDEELLPKDFSDKMSYIKKQQMDKVFKNNNVIPVFNDSYYFLTRDKYQDMKIPFSKKGHIVELDYFEYVNNHTWSTMFAMNWVSQIRYFHGFINNSIMFITGATGAGKSTQVPKLYLYASMVLHHNDSPQIICTQPRQNATEGNAIRIAQEMAVPIVVKKKVGIKEIDVPYDNYYLQYRHQAKKHSKNDSHKPMLKFVTDGTLLQELNNPIMKVMKEKNGKPYFINKNIYDAMMVDESHEHNANMDIILTLFRNLCFYNNSIRFGIISATMDDDEPTYRRFYRCLNDNLAYPMNKFHEGVNINDRIAVDRRFHISPPGKGTRFPIKEKYYPGKTIEELTIEIINSTTSGDVLVFQPGEARIRSVVEYINNNTPSNVIALGYFSKMGKKFKELIESVDKNKSQINIPKNYDMSAEYDEIPKINHIYSRVVIVATNIAEASITISTLRYVIDNGTQKIGEYDYITETTVQKEVDISESSRKQRKGRVGRVSWGEFHAIYPKGDKEETTTYFNISLSDLSEPIFRLMRNNINEGRLINNSMIPSYNNSPSIYQLRNDPTGIGRIILDNRYVNGLPFGVEETNYNLIGQQELPPMYYETGFDFNDLIDNNAKFYIVHPEERNIKRNINGDVSEVIQSDKMKSFEIKLQKMNFIESNKNKTQFGQNILKLKDLINIEDTRYILSYLIGRINGCHMEILFGYIVSMLTRGDISRLFKSYINERGKYRSYLPEMRKIYGDYFSDLITIKKIIDKILIDFGVNQFISKDALIKKLSSLEKQKITDNLLNEKFKDDKLLEIFEEFENSISDKSIEEWSNLNKIDGKMIREIIKKALNLNYYLLKASIQEKDLLEWFDDKLKGFKYKGMYHDKLAYSLYFGFSNRVFRSIGINNLGIMVSHPSPEYMLQIKMISPFYPVPVTLIKEDLIFGYAIFLDYKFDEEYDDSRTITMITKIKPEVIKNAKFINLSIKEYAIKIAKAKDDINNIINEISKYRTSKVKIFQPTILNSFFNTLNRIPSELKLPLVKKDIQFGGNQKIDLTKYYSILKYLIK